MAVRREQGGEPCDWAEIMRDYYGSACALIDRLMPRCLRSKYDPEDFVDDAIVELMANPGQLIEKGPTLLALVAKRRMIDAARSPRSRLKRLEVEVIDQQPSAVSETEAADLREWLLGQAGDSTERDVIDLRCSGHTLPEIAELTGSRLRTLQRFWKGFREAIEPWTGSLPLDS